MHAHVHSAQSRQCVSSASSLSLSSGWWCADRALFVVSTLYSRALLSKYCLLFQEAHAKQSTCAIDLTDWDIPSVLTHAEDQCTAHSTLCQQARQIWNGKIQSDSPLRSSLSRVLRAFPLFPPHRILFVPDALEPVETRWMIQYLKASWYTVRMVNQVGQTRETDESTIHKANGRKRKQEDKQDDDGEEEEEEDEVDGGEEKAEEAPAKKSRK